MKILRIRDVKLPARANLTDAGIDLFIPNDYPLTPIRPGESVLIPAGIKVNVPENHALILFNKSGIATKKGLVVGACVIDEPYQGEVHINLFNIGSKTQTIIGGDKITQAICIPVNYVNIEEVTSVDELYDGKITSRGDGGFGSTGTK